MPFREVCVEELREQMVLEALAGRRTKAEIAEQFGISRKRCINGWSVIRRTGGKDLATCRDRRTIWSARSVGQWRMSCAFASGATAGGSA